MPKVSKKGKNSSVPFPEGSVIIIGAGHFGTRAVKLLCERQSKRLYVVEKDEKALQGIHDYAVDRILAEGVPFLAHHAGLLAPSTIIVPALPVHLAFEWLRAVLKKNGSPRRIKVPAELKLLFPHAWEGSEGSLLVSYADFRCPDDCPEPADHCTVTGKKRGKPMYELIQDVVPAGYRVHVIRSRQLAPGLGGYSVGDLKGLLARVKSEGDSKWLVGTACKCHGVVSALEIRNQPEGETFEKANIE